MENLMAFEITSEIDVLTFISGSLSTIGAFFLVRGVLGSSARQLAALSGTYLGSNPHLERSLVEQKADTLFGFSFVLLSGVFWIACSVMKVSIKATMLTYLLLVIVDIALFCLCTLFAGRYRRFLGQKTALISFVNHLKAEVSYPKGFDENRLVDQAKKLGLEPYFDGATDPYDCLKKCAVAAGASPGAELIEEIRQSRKTS